MAEYHEIAQALDTAQAAIGRDDFDSAWPILLQILFSFRASPELRGQEPVLFDRLVAALRSMKNESDYAPLDRVLAELASDS